MRFLLGLAASGLNHNGPKLAVREKNTIKTWDDHRFTKVIQNFGHGGYFFSCENNKIFLVLSSDFKSETL